MRSGSMRWGALTPERFDLVIEVIEVEPDLFCADLVHGMMNMCSDISDSTGLSSTRPGKFWDDCSNKSFPPAAASA